MSKPKGSSELFIHASHSVQEAPPSSQPACCSLTLSVPQQQLLGWHREPGLAPAALPSQSSWVELAWRRGCHPLCHTPEPLSTDAHTVIFQGKRNLHHSDFWKLPSIPPRGVGGKSVCQNKICAPEGLWVLLNICVRCIYMWDPTGPFQCR